MFKRSYISVIGLMLVTLCSTGAWCAADVSSSPVTQVSQNLSSAQAYLAGLLKAGQVRIQDTAPDFDNCRQTSNCVARDLDIRFWGYYYYNPQSAKLKQMIAGLKVGLQQPGLSAKTISGINSTIGGMQNFIDTQKDTLAKMK